MTEIPLALLPRLCPLCGERTIVGHGQRLKLAHDQRHQQIWIRRGRCRPCHKTFTVLPDWSPPSGHYSLHCRQQAWELLHQADGTWERSVPDVADASRSPDPSTVRRWAGRLLHLGTLVSRKELNELKQQIPLLDYLEAYDWRPVRRLSRGRWMGLCPLHADHQPSFLMDPGKNLFYCYGCGRGGDVIRFAEIYHQVRFPQALALLQQWRGGAPLLHEAASFYRMQLHRHAEAVAYLHHRGLRSPELIEHMRIGYAPGGCLRGWLTRLGYTLPNLRQAGLVSAAGYDTYMHRIVFPLEGNLYGRSLSTSAPPHRFLPGAKGGLYSWKQIRQCPEVILVEGLFDYAMLWQAGFRNATCSLGSYLNAHQFRQLCDGRARTVYVTFDADSNGSGQQAAQRLAGRLREQGLNACRIFLPDGHDPNSFLVEGGDARQFQTLLEAARP